MSKAKRSTGPVAPASINPSTLAGQAGGASAASVVRHPGGLGDEGAGELSVLLSPMARRIEHFARIAGPLLTMEARRMEHFDDGAHALEGRVRARGMFYAAQPAAKLPELKPHALPVGDDQSAGLALTVNQSQVLQTMALFDGSRLLSCKMIAGEMDATTRLSEETVRQCVDKLRKSHLAERPEGNRSGARLSNAGRKLAGKIAH